MRGLLALVGATAPFTAGSWTFGDAAPPAARPTGGTLVVPYLANEIAYQYDAATNTYPRSVSREGPQIDAGNHRRVAPSNVIVLYMPVGRLWNTGPDSSNESSGRLDVRFVGSGTATVFANGVATAARWSKPNDTAPTVFTYAAGPNTGKPVPLVRGQIFVQVVASGTNVTWTPGQAPAAVP